MLEKYYNIETKTLTLPHEFNVELKDLPFDTKIIIFEENYYKGEHSIFNQKVDNLPKNLICLTFGHCFDQKVDNLPLNLTHLTLGWYFSKSVNNLPLNLEEVKIYRHKIYLLTKIPFGCEIVLVT